jgi:predicted enzyme related to lactoylglutathione lyase
MYGFEVGQVFDLITDVTNDRVGDPTYQKCATLVEEPRTNPTVQPPFTHSPMQVVEIAFTGYSVTDMKRAKGFYEGVLGLKKSRAFGQHQGDDQWVEYDIGPGCLAVIAGGGNDWPPHAAGTAAALEVDDFDGYVAKLRSSSVKFIWEPRETPICWMAVVADPDGNWLVIHHRKKK